MSRGAATGGRGDISPRFKIYGDLLCIGAPNFTTTYILISWSPPHTHHGSSAPTWETLT